MRRSGYSAAIAREKRSHDHIPLVRKKERKVAGRCYGDGWIVSPIEGKAPRNQTDELVFGAVWNSNCDEIST